MALVLVVAGCGDSDDTGGGDDMTVFLDPVAGVSVAAGERFAIELEGNPTTGFSWEIAEPYDEAVVTFLGEDYEPDDSGLVGSGGVERLSFVAGEPGSTTIVLEYVQPWDEEAEPAELLSFAVDVS
jgi:inhibitor of cysteine peptidase